MNRLISAVRPAECLLAALLGYIGFRHSGVRPDWFSIAMVSFVVLATMLQNDWRDREHDLGKGKTLAYEKPSQFLFWLLAVWSVCGGLLVAAFLWNAGAGSILAGMALVGLLYSETRRIPLLPLVVVSLTSASPLLLPLAFGASWASVELLFVAVVLILCGRETLHDIADKGADISYKQTVPVVFGERAARVVAIVALCVGCGFAIAVSPTCAIGTFFILWGLLGTTYDARVVLVRIRVDIGLVLLALSLMLI